MNSDKDNMCPLARPSKYVLPMECTHPYYHITDCAWTWMAIRKMSGIQLYRVGLQRDSQRKLIKLEFFT